MHWTEPADSDDSHAELEKRLWDAANQLWANADLKPSEFSPIVLGLIFLRYADVKFSALEVEIKPAEGSRRRKAIGPDDFIAKGVLFLPDESRFSHLLELPDGCNLGKAVNDAMRAVEKENPDLADVLPKSFQVLEDRTLATLLKQIASIPMDKGGDTFGLIYEYFLGKFAMSEGQKGGEFYTPTSLVKLIVEILEPYHGRIFDPACGSGGMFVQSARFVENHNKNTSEISIYGQERVRETSNLAKLNLAVHGLSGDIREGNTYYEDPHNSSRRFDFVLANPPFNVSKVDKSRITEDSRFGKELPRADNANYLWIKLFHNALNKKGRAGFVMANSASDARLSELEIREKLIKSGDVDVMVTIGPKFFFTVSLPCTLWFLDKGKKGTQREDTVLFLDASHINRVLSAAHRDFTPGQIEFIANIVRLYRGEEDALNEWVCEVIDGILISAQACILDEEADSAEPIPEFIAAATDWYEETKEARIKHSEKEKEADWFMLPENSPLEIEEGLRSQKDALQKHWNEFSGSDLKDVFLFHDEILKDFGEEMESFIETLKRFKQGAEKFTATKELRKSYLKLRPAINLAIDYLKPCAEPVDRIGRLGTTFPDGTYSDVLGLCKSATRAEIEAQGWSLNPGRYVGVAAGEEMSDEDFKEKLEGLNEELETLNAEARELEEKIAGNVAEIFEAI